MAPTFLVMRSLVLLNLEFKGRVFGSKLSTFFRMFLILHLDYLVSSTVSATQNSTQLSNCGPWTLHWILKSVLPRRWIWSISIIWHPKKGTTERISKGINWTDTWGALLSSSKTVTVNILATDHVLHHPFHIIIRTFSALCSFFVFFSRAFCPNL